MNICIIFNFDMFFSWKFNMVMQHPGGKKVHFFNFLIIV